MLLCMSLVTTVVLAACNKTHIVTYQSGNSEATGTAPESQSYNEGDEVTVAQNTFVLDGYTFVGWSDGTKTYKEGEKFIMPAQDVTLTAQWNKNSVTPPDSGDPVPPPGPSGDEDKPTLTELNAKFYNPDNWEYMTSKGGAEIDGGDKVYALNDGSVKFHRENQAVQLDEKITKASFMIKATNDFALWFNSSSKDNNSNSSYRLVYGYSQLRLVVSSNPEEAAAVVTSTYKKAEWNRIDIELTESVVDGETVCAIKLYVNEQRATLSVGGNTSQITVANNVMTHTQKGTFETGTYIVAKCWEADNYFQIKPVSKSDENDVPVVAAIGASITEGAGADNFYTESYPAQLQNALGGGYNVINFGKSGRTVRTDTGDESDGTPVPWLENRQWTGVQAIKPDIAIINMGTNDSKTSLNPVSTQETFKAAYEHLLEELLTVNPDMRIIVCTVPMAYSGIYDINNDNIQKIIAPVQREIAKERGLELVDLYKITEDKSMLFTDGVHPDTRGYGMFAKIFKEVVINGDEALTEEFLAEIDEEYNDPCALSAVHAEIAVENDQINLTVTGHVEKLTQKGLDESKLRLNLDTGEGEEIRDQAFTLGDNGDFRVTARLDDLTGTHWYIIRLYLTDSYSYIVMLDDCEYTVGQVFTATTRKVTVQTWSNRLNLKIEDVITTQLEITQAAISTTEHTLTVTGTTDAEALRFYVGVHPTEEGKWRHFEPITIVDGSFTVVYDLAKLFEGADVVSDYINVRIYFGTDDVQNYVVVPLAKTTLDGQPAAVGNHFNTENTTISIQSWPDGGVGTLSLRVTPYDSSLVVTITEITFDEQYLVVKGTVIGNVTKLTLALHNDNDMTDNIRVDATLTEGQFEAKLDLTKITLGANKWLYLWYSVDDGTDTKVQYDKNDTKHVYGNREYRFEYYEGIAIAYSNYTPPVPEDVKIEITELKFDGANLVVKGTVTGAQALKFDLYASEDSEQYEADAEITDGNFEVSILLPPSAEAHHGSWYFLRVSADDAGYSNVNWTEHGAQVAETKSATHTNGSYQYKFVDSSDNIAIMTSGVTYTLTLTSVKVEETDGKIILTLEGSTTDSALKFFVGEDSLSEIGTSEKYNHAEDVTLDSGKFTHTFDLATCPVGGWYNIRFYFSSGEYYAVSYEEAVNAEGIPLKTDDSFVGTSTKVTVKSWGDKGGTVNTFSIQVEAYTPPEPSDPIVTVSAISFEEGEFVVIGTVENVTHLYIYLINTNVENSKTNYVDATITEGDFEARLSLDTLIGYAQNSTIPFNLRYKVDSTDVATVNVQRGVLDITQVHVYNNKTFTIGLNGGCVALYYADTTKAVYATSISFEGDNVVIKGVVTGEYTTLKFYVQNTSPNTQFEYTVDITELVNENGEFELTISLAEFESAQSGAYLNFRVQFDSDTSLVGLAKGQCDLSATHVYEGRTYSFALKDKTVYIVYKAA